MIISVKDFIFNENNLNSCIIGQHGKEPWDFEFTLPISPDYFFLESCLYEDVVIDGAERLVLDPGVHDPYDAFKFKRYFTITKIEKRITEEESLYIVSGIGKPERLLENSVALWDLKYNTGEHGSDFVERVFNTFTHNTINIEQTGGLSLNFEPIKKGDFVSRWFWDNFKKEQGVCVFRYNVDANTYSLFCIDESGKNDKLIGNYISKTSVWEKFFNAGFALGNSSIFRFGEVSGRLFFSSEVKTGSFASRNLEFALPWPGHPLYAGNSSLTSVIDGVFRARSYNDSGGHFYQGKFSTFSYQHQYSAAAFGSPHKSVEVLLMPNTTIEDDPTGRVSIFPMNGVNIEDIAKKLRVVQINYNTNPPTITNLSYRIEGDSAYYDNWPLVSDFNSNYQYGILCSHSYSEGFVTDPVTSPVSDQGVLDVLALSGISFKFPKGNPTVDYEIAESQFEDMQVGDNIVNMEGGCSILTDKVISYENGEVHYDCTTKDLLEIEAKQ